MASDVFPGLDVKNPLDTLDTDEIPARFGPQWFQYEREQSKPTGNNLLFEDSSNNDEQAAQEERVFSKLDDRDIDDLDSHLDSQKRLMFTETRMRAVAPEE